MENVTDVDAGEETPPNLDPDLGDDRHDADSEIDSSDGEAPEDAAPTVADGGQAVGVGDSSLADAAPDASQAVDAGNACNPNPCQHGGRCSHTDQGASCDCGGTGYTNATCETDIDECGAANACSNAAYPCVQTEAPGYTCQGQFADWPMPDAIAGPKAKPSYDTTSVTDVVIDNVTGLAWQRNPPSETRSWQQAKSYCQSLALGGFDDWRLPTKIELESLMDDTRTGPSINRDAFPDPMRAMFLSASPVVGQLADAPWLVEFFYGLTLPSTVSDPVANVWCVRTARRPGSLPEERYTFGISGGLATATDTRTGLVWERDLYSTKVDWDGARQRCASLGGRWRLPTKKELLTLVDPTINIQTPPPIDLDAFPGTPADARFWSSVVQRSAGGGSWLLDRNGTPRGMPSTESNYVRCVQ